MAEPEIFEIINSTRGIKRLKPDPVPLGLIKRALDVGTKAPSGVNTQPWQFVVVRDSETEKRVQERYLRDLDAGSCGLLGLDEDELVSVADDHACEQQLPVGR